MVAGCTTGMHKVTGVILPAVSPNQVVVYYSGNRRISEPSAKYPRNPLAG